MWISFKILFFSKLSNFCVSTDWLLSLQVQKKYWQLFETCFVSANFQEFLAVSYLSGNCFKWFLNRFAHSWKFTVKIDSSSNWMKLSDYSEMNTLQSRGGLRFKFSQLVDLNLKLSVFRRLIESDSTNWQRAHKIKFSIESHPSVIWKFLAIWLWLNKLSRNWVIHFNFVTFVNSKSTSQFFIHF